MLSADAFFSPSRRLNAFLGSINIGDYVVLGQLEAYSCARASPPILLAPAPLPLAIPQQKPHSHLASLAGHLPPLAPF
jgi:hypothetical protein